MTLQNLNVLVCDIDDNTNVNVNNRNNKVLESLLDRSRTVVFRHSFTKA